MADNRKTNQTLWIVVWRCGVILLHEFNTVVEAECPIQWTERGGSQWWRLTKMYLSFCKKEMKESRVANKTELIYVL